MLKGNNSLVFYLDSFMNTLFYHTKLLPTRHLFSRFDGQQSLFTDYLLSYPLSMTVRFQRRTLCIYKFGCLFFFFFFFVFGTCEDLGGRVDDSYPRLRSFFLSEDKLVRGVSVQLCRSGSAHSDSASCGDCGGVYPAWFCVSPFP